MLSSRLRANSTRILFSLALSGTGVSARAASTSRTQLPQCREAFPLDRKSCQKEWAVLVYMAADNDLAPYALMDLYEMEAGYESGRAYAGSTRKSDVLVQLDGPGTQETLRYHMRQSPNVYRSRQAFEFVNFPIQTIESPVVDRLPETDSADPKTLSDFLTWALEEYPARHHLVIVWGHGQGWASGPQSFGGIASDDLSHSRMSIPELASVMKTTAQWKGESWDAFITDACLMQTVEVVTELSGALADDPAAPWVNFITGSTEVLSRQGLPYRRLLYELNTGHFLSQKKRMQSQDEAWLLARMLPELGVASFDPVHGLQGRLEPTALETYTLSSVSAFELRSELLPALEHLGLELDRQLNEAPDSMIDVVQALEQVPSYVGGTRDLGGVLVSLHGAFRESDNIALKGSLEKAIRALDRTVMSSAFGSRLTGKGLESLGFKAVAVWAPTRPEEFQEKAADFERALFQWGNWRARINNPSVELNRMREHTLRLFSAPRPQPLFSF